MSGGTRSVAGLIVVVLLLASLAGAAEFVTPPQAVKRPWPVLENSMTTMEMRVYAVRTDQAPVLDGKTDDPCWQRAFTVSTLGREGFKGYTPRKNVIRFLYDDTALYIACTGEINSWHEGLAEVRAHGDSVWMDDCFEIFVDPGLTRKTYWQFIVNAAGSMEENKGRQPTRVDWEVKTAHTDRSWTAEVKIPFPSLGVAAPKKGEAWGVNVFRNDKDLNESYSVSPVLSSSHDPSRFAALEFGETPEAYLDDFNYDKIVKGDNVFRFRAFGQGLERAVVRGQVKTADGKAEGEPREVKLSATEEIKFPFTLTNSGPSHLDMDIVKDGRVLGKYRFLANVYEEHLLILVPGGADFVQGRDKLNLRLDLRVNPDAVGLFKIELALKKGAEILQRAKIDRIPGGFSDCDMNIGDLAIGSYTLTGRLIGADGKEADSFSTPIRIIEGPFSSAKLAPPATIVDGPAGTVPEQFTTWGATGRDMIYRECTAKQIAEMKAQGKTDADVEALNKQYDCRNWPEVQDDSQKPQTAFTDAEKQQGYVLFNRPYVDRVYDYTIPEGHERVSELHAFAAQGQYEPITLSIHALKDLKAVAAKVTTLMGPEGAILPKESLDVRVVRSYEQAYGSPWWNPEMKDPVTRIPRKKIMPLVIEKRDSSSVPAGQSRQFWITLKVPDDCKGGIYQGNIELTIDGAARTVPLKIRVLPFQLVQLKKAAFMDEIPSGDGVFSVKDAYYDYGEHGFNVIEFRVGLPQKDQKAVEGFFKDWMKSKDPKALPPLADPNEVLKFNAPKLEEAIKAAHDAHLDVEQVYLKLWGWEVAGWNGWYVYYPTSKELDQNYADIVNKILAFNKTRGLPGLMVFPGDEPGGHPDTLLAVQHYLEVISKSCPGASAGITIGGGMAMDIDEVGMLGPYCKVLDTNYLNEKILRQVKKTVPKMWICNAGSMSGDPRLDRYGFGFCSWKLGADGMAQWAYYAHNPYDQVYEGQTYVWPSAEMEPGTKFAKPIPTIQWEAMRQAFVDQRYGATLTKLIEIANGGDDAKAKDTAVRATAVIKDVLTQFHLDYMNRRFPNGVLKQFYTYSIDGDYFNTCRWRLAQEILNLETVLGDKGVLDPKEKVFPLTPEETMFN